MVFIGFFLKLNVLPMSCFLQNIKVSINFEDIIVPCTIVWTQAFSSSIFFSEILKITKNIFIIDLFFEFSGNIP